MRWAAFLLMLLASPEAWVALVTLVVLEVVLGIDNLIFISILTNKLPPEHRARARRIGIGLALVMRLGLLATIAWMFFLLCAPLSAPAGGWRPHALLEEPHIAGERALQPLSP